MQYRTTHNLPRLEEALKQYPVEKMSAAVRAINRTASTVRAESARRLQVPLGGIKIGVIKSRIKQTRASSNSTSAALDYTSTRFGLYRNLTTRRINTKWGTGVLLGRRPLSLELADGTPITEEQFGRLFLQRSRRTGRPTVWTRIGKRSLPFQSVVVSGVAENYRRLRLAPEMLALGRARMATVLEQEFRFRLAKR